MSRLNILVQEAKIQQIHQIHETAEVIDIGG